MNRDANAYPWRCLIARTLAAAAALLALAAPAQAQQANSAALCGELANGFGPFDYRPEFFRPPPGDQMPHKEKLYLVEKAHFTPQVEALIRGQSTHTTGPDLDYTLRAFPNHHRALASLMRLAERSKQPAPAGLPRSIECYLDRAVRFVPNDPIVRLFFANFLSRQGRASEAGPHLRAALDLAGDNPFTHYNIGLVYLEAGDHAAALTQAHRAMALGFPRQELKQRLVAAGKWVDPAPDPAAGSGSPPDKAVAVPAPPAASVPLSRP